MRMSRVAMCLFGPLVALPAAKGGTVDMFFCVKSQGGGSCSSPCMPETPTLYLAPQDQNEHFSEGFGVETFYHVGVLSVRMDVAARGDGCGFETITSIGLDVNASGPSAPYGPSDVALSAADLDIFTFASDTNSPNDPWSGTQTVGTGGAAPDLISDARAMAVPISHGDSLWSGFCPDGDPAPGTYQFGELTLSAGASDGPLTDPQTEYSLNMAVGSLKIGRSYDPTSTQGGVPEEVSFGYSGDVPDGAVSGSEPGATSVIPDAKLVIRRKGDFGSTDPNG